MRAAIGTTGLVLFTGLFGCQPQSYYLDRLEVHGEIGQDGRCTAAFASPRALRISLPASGWHRDAETLTIICRGSSVTTLFFDLPFKGDELATPTCFRFGNEPVRAVGLNCKPGGSAEVHLDLREYVATNGELTVTALTRIRLSRYESPGLRVAATFDLRGHRTHFWCVDC